MRWHMDLKTFFERYVLEHEMIRANLINVASFANQSEFINFKMGELFNESDLKRITANMSVSETKLIKQLYYTEPSEELIHHVNYDIELYGTLIDYQYILEDVMNYGVIHHDIVSMLYQAMAASGVMPMQDMYIKDELSLAEHQMTQLKDIYTGPIYWFYNNLKFEELRKILSRLNVKPDGQYKEEYIKQLIPLLTDTEYLKRALLTIEASEYQSIYDNVKNNQHIYRKKSRWTASKKVGLLVEIHRDYLAMHEDVMNALKIIDFKLLSKDRKNLEHLQVEDYNAYHLELRIPYDTEDIVREVYLPTAMNFFEFERIIKEAMGWKLDSGSYFETETFKIYSKQLEAVRQAEDKISMVASLTQIDAIIDHSMQLTYEYNPEAGYSVYIYLKKLINLDRKIPEVIYHKGPIPIDNIGGITCLTKVLNILEDSTHQEYVPIYQKIRRLNYKERYPMSAINKRFAETFKKSYPLTEFNE